MGATDAPCNCWMVVTSPANFATTEETGWSVQGLKSRHRKRAAMIVPGDRLVYYLTGLQSFAATVTVTGQVFESHEPIWTSKPGEDYPWRFPIRLDMRLPIDAYLRADTLHTELQFVRKWPAQHWHLAFQGNIHLLPRDDFLLIEKRMRGMYPDS